MNIAENISLRRGAETRERTLEVAEAAVLPGQVMLYRDFIRAIFLGTE